MLKRDLQMLFDEASDDQVIGIVVCSIESGTVMAVSFDVVADINEYGVLLLCTQIETTRPSCFSFQ